MDLNICVKYIRFGLQCTRPSTESVSSYKRIENKGNKCVALLSTFSILWMSFISYRDQAQSPNSKIEYPA